VKKKVGSLVFVLTAVSLISLGANSAIHKSQCKKVQVNLNVEDKTSKLLFLQVQNAALQATRNKDSNEVALKNRAIAFYENFYLEAADASKHTNCFSPQATSAIPTLKQINLEALHRWENVAPSQITPVMIKPLLGTYGTFLSLIYPSQMN
jgi:hypothetical protein